MTDKKPRKKKAYQMPDPLPKGEKLQSINKKEWVLGPSIGVGGFGEIYSANEAGDKKSSYPYVIKIEPHVNGPLFVEMHFYMRNAKQEDIQEWCQKKKFKTFGMPAYIGSGSHQCNGTKYRFVVMEKFGKDLWKIFLENKRSFPTHTAYRIAIQMLDVLEYIHDKGYVHMDIKGANILLGIHKSNENQCYLVDFGLAAHYTTKDFKPDPKKAHNGTIEYASRDAHSGVPTRRGDIEILGYNLLHWLGADLPWEKCLNDPVAVQNAKNKFMDSVDQSLSSCFKKKDVPDALKKFFQYISKMDYNTKPDYEKCRKILTSGVETAGGSLTGPLNLSQKPQTPKRKSTGADKEVTPQKKSRVKKIKKIKENDNSSDDEQENIEKNKKTETPIRRGRSKKEKEVEIISNSESEDEHNGFTAEMMRVKKKMEDKKKTKIKSKKVLTAH